jgi:hypothetical protein
VRHGQLLGPTELVICTAGRCQPGCSSVKTPQRRATRGRGLRSHLGKVQAGTTHGSTSGQSRSHKRSPVVLDPGSLVLPAGSDQRSSPRWRWRPSRTLVFPVTMGWRVP